MVLEDFDKFAELFLEVFSTIFGEKEAETGFFSPRRSLSPTTFTRPLLECVLHPGSQNQ
jgi:hypothetical protein